MDNLLHDSVKINSKMLSFVFHTGCKVIASIAKKKKFLHRVNFLYTRIKHEKKTLIVYFILILHFLLCLSSR